jgi:hypothetical protein
LSLSRVQWYVEGVRQMAREAALEAREKFERENPLLHFDE